MNSKFWGAAVCSLVILQATAGGCKASCWCGGAGGIQIFQIFRMSRWHGVAVRDRLVGALLTLFSGQATDILMQQIQMALLECQSCWHERPFPKKQRGRVPFEKDFLRSFVCRLQRVFGWSDALILNWKLCRQKREALFRSWDLDSSGTLDEEAGERD